MIVDKSQLLKEYININVGPILVESFDLDILSSCVIPSNISEDELYGYYEGESYISPNWYQSLVNNNYKLIIIDGIDNISKEEQLKFFELLKYKKVSIFDVPEDCSIVLTAKNINRDTINEKIFSLCVYVRG